MVAGKVKMAMGLQKSPSSNNKNNSKPPDKSPASAKPSSPSPGSTGKQKTTMFNRSFGVYFPRASAQVQPQPQPSLPDVGDLLKLVEDLRERESRLKVELVEQKLLSRSAAVVPFLEGQITSKNAEIERLSNKVIELEIENEKLALERELIEERFDSEMSERDAKIAKMEAEMRERDAKIAKIEAEMREREAKIAKMEAEIEEGKQLSSSQRFQFNKSNLAKSLSFRRVSKCNEGLKLGDSEWITRKDEVQVEVETTRHSRSKSSDDIPGTSDSDSFSAIVVKSKGPRVPKPPPKRSSSDSSLSSCSSLLSDGCRSTDSISAPPSPPPPPPTVRFSPSTVKSAPPPPPPPPLKKASASTSTSAPSPPPPPPPPPPHKKASASASTSEPPPAPPVPPPAMEMKAVTVAKVKRAPEVVEFYQSLMKRDSRRDSGTGTAEVTAASAKDLVGEIENRSVYLRAIKSDVKTQGEFVRFLINEVETAAFTDIEDVVSFVKWLDDELTYLVDERAVLKHFDWPEKKADALREAAFEYSDLKKLESEASSFKDDARQTCTSTLKKMQTLLEKLEHGVFNLSRLRESATIRFKSFHIPIDWMLDAGFASQFKLASVKLAMKYMKRVSAELEAMGGGPDEEELIVQGVRFAFRVHQFAGGFDVETMRAFEELRDKARSCHI